MLVAAVPAFAGNGARGADVHIRVTDCSQAQGTSARQTQRGDARAHKNGSAAHIKQKGKIHQKQGNACRHGKAAGGGIRLH
jgi:hypothetical protein